jgi:hypothetical protein
MSLIPTPFPFPLSEINSSKPYQSRDKKTASQTGSSFFRSTIGLACSFSMYVLPFLKDLSDYFFPGTYIHVKIN